MYKANCKKMEILKRLNERNNRIVIEMKKRNEIIKRSDLSLRDRLNLLKI